MLLNIQRSNIVKYAVILCFIFPIYASRNPYNEFNLNNSNFKTNEVLDSVLRRVSLANSSILPNPYRETKKSEQRATLNNVPNLTSMNKQREIRQLNTISKNNQSLANTSNLSDELVHSLNATKDIIFRNYNFNLRFGNLSNTTTLPQNIPSNTINALPISITDYSNYLQTTNDKFLIFSQFHIFNPPNIIIVPIAYTNCYLIYPNYNLYYSRPFVNNLEINFLSAKKPKVQNKKTDINSTSIGKIKQLITKAAKQYNIPVELLMAIGKVESKLKPYAINHNGKSYYYATEADAITAINNILSRNDTNFGVGCFQLHYKSHKSHFRSIKDMVNPQNNIKYAAWFLSKLYKNNGYNWDKAVKKYHSRNDVLGNNYKYKVMKYMPYSL